MLRVIDIEAQLKNFSEQVRPMPGIQNPSDRRILASYIAHALQLHIELHEKSKATTPDLTLHKKSSQFDPVNTVIYYRQSSNHMEAWWLLFLVCWFGQNSSTGWQLLHAFYYRLDSGKIWNWQAVVNSPDEFGDWILANQKDLKKTGLLGDDHKQKSFDEYRAEKAKQVFVKVIHWWDVNFTDKIAKNQVYTNTLPKSTFSFLYNVLLEGLEIDPVLHYRLLSKAGILGVAALEPDRPFLTNGGAYKKAARWIFQGTSGPKLRGRELTEVLTELATYLDIPFSFSVLEDAISNLDS